MYNLMNNYIRNNMYKITFLLDFLKNEIFFYVKYKNFNLVIKYKIYIKIDYFFSSNLN